VASTPAASSMRQPFETNSHPSIFVSYMSQWWAECRRPEGQALRRRMVPL
jgi:hypothetical protein